MGKFSIPRKIEIFGNLVTVKQVKDLKDEEDTKLDGEFKKDKNLILLEKSLDTVKKFKTFLHECLHAVWHYTGSGVILSQDAEDIMIDNAVDFVFKLIYGSGRKKGL